MPEQASKKQVQCFELRLLFMQTVAACETGPDALQELRVEGCVPLASPVHPFDVKQLTKHWQSQWHPILSVTDQE